MGRYGGGKGPQLKVGIQNTSDSISSIFDGDTWNMTQGPQQAPQAEILGFWDARNAFSIKKISQNTPKIPQNFAYGVDFISCPNF